MARPAVLVTTPALARELGDDGTSVLAVDPANVEAATGSRTAPVARAADDVAVLIFTSGTAGEAKAAELTHRAIAWNARALADGLAMSATDVHFAAAPLSHVLGMSGVMNASLLSGGALALMERFDAAAALRLIERTGSNGVMGAPQMFLALLREARRQAPRPSCASQ